MGKQIFLTQRTNRHVIKALNSIVAPAVYTGQFFGTFGTPGRSNSTLDSPWGVAVDAFNNVYICDNRNKRIVKLDSSFAYVSEYSTISTVDVPYAIMFDSVSGDLYVVGVYNNRSIRIEHLTTSLVSVLVSGNLNDDGTLLFRPTGIAKGFGVGHLLVIGANLNIYETIETASFSAFTVIMIEGEVTTYPKLYATTVYNSIVHHSNNDVYVNNSRMIIRVNSSYVNIGDSDIISKTITGLKECPDGSFLVYVDDTMTLKRYDENMNFIEDVYVNGGLTIDVDAYNIADFVEVTI